MKHVFVETNFLIDLLRPFSTTEAGRLMARNGVDVTLYLPWCSVAEAKRTLERIVREDLAFIDNAGRFLRRVMAGAQRPPPPFHGNVRQFLEEARELRRERTFDVPTRVDALAAQLTVIPPSGAVVQRTLRLSVVKPMTPFDEMVLGAVLEHAAGLHARNVSPLLFCNLNKQDFTPTAGNDLAAAYAAVGLEYRTDFTFD